jgi:phosphoribosyl-ATP pyrophosphohydrolase/phosphoribosyl-AMP cyclohydrolase
LIDPAAIRWNESGLVPAIAADAATGEVLMLAWMNAEALERTETSGEAWIWSRSRGELWHKGATSGNTLSVVDAGLDCDGDTVLLRVRPAGPACHRGTPSCWDIPTGGATAALDGTLAQRRRQRPAGSYAVKLFDDEALRCKKVGEEATELVHAALRESDARVAEEAADLIFHIAALLHGRGLTLAGALRVLDARHGKAHRGNAPG